MPKLKLEPESLKVMTFEPAVPPGEPAKAQDTAGGWCETSDPRQFCHNACAS